MAPRAKESKLRANQSAPVDFVSTTQATSTARPAGSSKIVIGVDEAGYGPNIGPLLIAGSVWRVPAEMSESDMCEALKPTFACKAWSANCNHVPLGDSKQLYTPGSGLRSLEAGLLSTLACIQSEDAASASFCKKPCETTTNSGAFNNFLNQFVSANECDWRQTNWYQDTELDCPASIDTDEVVRLKSLGQAHLLRCDIELLAVRAMVVSENRFNELVVRLGSKADFFQH